jgi:hypothetical protein
MTSNADRMQRIRERQRDHDQALEAATWFTAAQLAHRWHVSLTTVYMIPRTALPYLSIGQGKRPIRRYSPTAVTAYEAHV